MNKNLFKIALSVVIFSLIFGCAETTDRPKFNIDPGNWDFGNVNVGDSVDKDFKVMNPGKETLIIASISFIGTSNTDYSITNGGPTFEILPGESHDITVTFTPSAIGNRGVIMRFEHNTTGSSNDVVIEGTGTQPTFDITPTSWNFGGIEVGSSDSKEFEIQNNGTGILSVSSIVFIGTSPGNYLVTAGATTFTLTPGSTHKFTVEFTPTKTGNRDTTMSISHNAVSSPTVITIQGTGTQPQFDITPDKWDFGVCFLGNHVDKDFEIKNTGTSVLNVTSIKIISGDFKDFSMVTTVTNFQVNPGSTHKITARFSPQSLGSRVSMLQITHNASGSPTDIRIEGMGAIFLGSPNNTITVNNASEIKGIAVDKNNDNIWVSCHATGNIYRMDYNSPYNELSKFSSPASNPVGLALYNNNLYSTDSVTKKVYEISTSNGYSSVLFDVSYYVNSPSGIAYDGNYFYIGDTSGKIYVFNNTGTLNNTLNTGISSIGNIVWDGKYLRVCDMQNDKILAIDANTGATVESVNSPISNPYGLGWDGSDLYIASEKTNKINKFVP